MPATVYGSNEIPDDVKTALEDMMLGSREAVVDYMMPLGFTICLLSGTTTDRNLGAILRERAPTGFRHIITAPTPRE